MPAELSQETFRAILSAAMQEHSEYWPDVIACTLNASQLESSFDKYVERIGFTVLTTDRVYFPVASNTGYWVGSVSRHPDGIPTFI
jgi:hypothetical protein